MTIEDYKKLTESLSAELQKKTLALRALFKLQAQLRSAMMETTLTLEEVYQTKDPAAHTNEGSSSMVQCNDEWGITALMNAIDEVNTVEEAEDE